MSFMTCQDSDKKAHEAYATGDPTATSAADQEDMAREAIKKFRSLDDSSTD